MTGVQWKGDNPYSYENKSNLFDLDFLGQNVESEYQCTCRDYLCGSSVLSSFTHRRKYSSRVPTLRVSPRGFGLCNSSGTYNNLYI